MIHCNHLLLLLAWLANHTSANAALIRVHYGYFPEASPTLVACARGWFTYENYHVTCYPQTSGTFAVSRLDSGSQLHLADLGSTPLIQGLARGADIRVVYINHYKGDSQGIYVRPTEDASGYRGIEHPFDLMGKRLGVPFGSTMHYQVLFLLNTFGMMGKVELMNLSPAEIVKAWDERSIDAAACWGVAREHVLEGSDHPGNVLVSSGVLADWGRETFNAVAVRRDFMEDHADFVRHFASILGLLTDSFIDKLGEANVNNVNRWTPSIDPVASYLPSLTDSLMKAGEEARHPSSEFINDQRRALDLYKFLSTEEQRSCGYLGGGEACGKPSQLHIATQQTAKFLVDQKILHSMGKLAFMGDNETTGTDCSRSDTICGSDAFTLASLEPDLYSLDDWDGVPPFYALNETGRAIEGESSAGDSDCSTKSLIATTLVHYIGDVFRLAETSFVGQSYSDNLDCWWVIKSTDTSRDTVELSFQQVRIWSGDFIYVYSDPSMECDSTSKTKVLLGKITGLDPELPNFLATGCILVHFESDANQERSYNDIENIGDGFSASYKTTTVFRGISSPRGYECPDGQWGSDCSLTKHCLGTTHIDLGDPVAFSSTRTISSGKEIPYRNNLDCIFEIKAAKGNYISFEVEYDIEPTYDYLQLFSGTYGSASGVTPYAFLSAENTKHTYYIPTDDSGYATIHFVTDPLGRRSGFSGSVSAAKSVSSMKSCPVGQSGLLCEIPHCIAQNSIERYDHASSPEVDPTHYIGRVASQIKINSIPANIYCSWPLGKTLGDAVGIRLRFNSPLDLEPQPVAAVGDKIVVNAGDKVAAEVFVEQCSTDDVCSYYWQTGKCEDGACAVRLSVDVGIENFSSAEIKIVTDRSDGGKYYSGVDFDTLFISTCPSGDNVHCEADAGVCVDGGCICDGNIPCTCPCDTGGLVSVFNATLMWILVPIVVLFVAIFIWYRRRKIKKSRAQKAIIQEKEEELEAFRNSIVGMRTATKNYMPKPMSNNSGGTQLSSPAPRQEKVQWCWRETDHLVSNHAPDMIVGNAADGWIKYDPHHSATIETAFRAYKDDEDEKKNSLKFSIDESLKKLTALSSPSGSLKKLTAFSPDTAAKASIVRGTNDSKSVVVIDGYKIDVQDMKQTKVATGFEREIQRNVEIVDTVPEMGHSEITKVDLSNVEVGSSLPDDLNCEPQMALVKGDILQISSQRQDGWAFGSKLHHNDEATARELVRLASKGAADAHIYSDTGWFTLDTTEIPTGDELALLQTKVGSADLDAPLYWDDIKDPTIVQLHRLKQTDKEYKSVTEAFMSTLKPPKFNKKVKVVKVDRIQNLAMWQSYVVKRQTICYRETGGQDGTGSPEVMRRAIERFERKLLWHGTNVEGKSSTCTLMYYALGTQASSPFVSDG